MTGGRPRSSDRPYNGTATQAGRDWNNKCQVWLLADTKMTPMHLQITYTQSITVPLAEVCSWWGKERQVVG